MEAVDNQLRGNNTGETKETFNRLVNAGYDEQTAKEMIGSVLTEDIYDILKNKKGFDEEKYVKKSGMLK